MELKFDLSKTYAIALEGGGARGAYQIGAWQALKKAGIKVSAISGSSVGTLNGALILMDDMDFAHKLWNNMSYSKVASVGNDQLDKFFNGNPFDIDFKRAFTKLKKILKNGGVDITPLKKLISEHVDYEKIRSSDVSFFICTTSISECKSVELDAKNLSEKQLKDMLLASACFPGFKNEKIDGKRYTDGGVSNIYPLSPLLSRGYKDIIAIRLYGLGIKKLVPIPRGTTITQIAPRRKLGSMLNFNTDLCRKNYSLGYYDACRLLYGLYGTKYYVDRTLSEEEAHQILFSIVKNKLGEKATLRQLNTELYRLSRYSGAKGDYYDVLVSFMEKTAEKMQLDEYEIFTDIDLLKKLGLDQHISKEGTV